MTMEAVPEQRPACAGTQVPRFHTRALSFARCKQCGHWSARLRTSGEQLSALYQVESYAGFREDPVFDQVIEEQVATHFAPRLPAGAAILDVGCGNGAFLAAADRFGYDVQGLDISEAAAQMCRSRGLKATAGDFLTLEQPRRYDAVTMWDVIEHLPAPAAFVRRALDVLNPGGYLVIKTPMISDATFQVVSLVLRLAAGVLQTPAHIQFFTEESMARLARATGLETVERIPVGAMRGRPPTGSLRKVIARRIIRAIHWVFGAESLYVWLKAPAPPLSRSGADA